MYQEYLDINILYHLKKGYLEIFTKLVKSIKILSTSFTESMIIFN